VGVAVVVAVVVGVDVSVGVDVTVDDGTPWRTMIGFSQMALSILFPPFAFTTRINFTVFPERALKSRSIG
jgi:hypothetical protein